MLLLHVFSDLFIPSAFFLLLLSSGLTMSIQYFHLQLFPHTGTLSRIFPSTITSAGSTPVVACGSPMHSSKDLANSID